MSAADASPTPEHTRPPARAWLPLVLCGLLWMALGLASWMDERQTLAEKTAAAVATAREFASHVELRISAADQVARLVRAEYSRAGENFDVRRLIRESDLVAQDFQLISVVDAHGLVIRSSQTSKPVDVSDREHFKVQSAATADRLFISKPVIGKTTGQPTIQVTRRIADAHGAFAGETVVSLPPTMLLDAADFSDRDSVIAVYGLDGTSRVRQTPAGTSWGKASLVS